MTPGFEEALGLWESGELSRDELARRFPEEDIAGLLDAFDRMSTAAVAPAPDASAAWEVVRVKLPARLADRRRGRGKAIRLLAAAMIAVLVLGASAYAVVPSVRKALDDAAGVVTGEDHDDSPDPTRPAESTRPGADQPIPGLTGNDGSTTDSDDGAAGVDDAETDANEPNSDSDSDGDGVEGDSGSATDDGSGSHDGSVDESGSGEERAGDAVDGDSSGSGSEEPDS